MVTRDIERNIMDYLVGSNLTKPHLKFLSGSTGMCDTFF